VTGGKTKSIGLGYKICTAETPQGEPAASHEDGKFYHQAGARDELLYGIGHRIGVRLWQLKLTRAFNATGRRQFLGGAQVEQQTANGVLDGVETSLPAGQIVRL
jgi:hypothetical protein